MQGSATSPAGMALFHNLLSYYNKTSGVLQGLFKIFAALRCGFQADAMLWVDISSIFRRGDQWSAPCGAAFRLTRRFGWIYPQFSVGRPLVGTLRCGFQADVTLWVDISSIFRRGGVSPPVCRKFYLTSRRRTSEPPLCKGRCRVKRGGGVVPDTNQLLCSANFMLLQSLRRSRASPLYWGGALRATNGRPFKSPLPGGGWRRQAAGGARATKRFVLISDTSRQTSGVTTV